MEIRIISPFDRNESESQKNSRKKIQKEKGIPKKTKDCTSKSFIHAS